MNNLTSSSRLDETTLVMLTGSPGLLGHELSKFNFWLVAFLYSRGFPMKEDHQLLVVVKL